MKNNRAMLMLLLPALLTALALLLAGCKDFSFYSVLGDRIDQSPPQIAPASASVVEGSTLDFTATGGVPPYTFSLASGPGSFVDADTYLASTVGVATVQVTDSKGRSGSAPATITVSSLSTTLVVAPTSVSVLVGESVTFYVAGGTPPYTFSFITNNSGAPAMSDENYTAGLIGGVADTIRVDDSAASTPATATVNVVIAPVADVDYRVSATNFPSAGSGGKTIPAGYDFTIENRGTAPGAQPVSWWVLISQDASLGNGDAILSSGSTTALAAGDTAPVALSGTWPPSGGTKYLFVLLAAGDDPNNANNDSGGDAVTLTAPDVDYEVSNLTPGAGTTAGGPLSGTFDLTNSGTSDGSQPVSWTAYLSTDAAWDAADPVVDAGSRAALGAGSAQAGIAFSGSWPAAAGTYYLIVDVYAFDEPSPADASLNTLASGAVAVAPPPIDYLVTAVSSTGATLAGGPLTGSFQYRNNLSAAGSQPVHWIAYVSTDSSWDAADPVIDSGDAAALAGSTTSGAVGFDGTWPAGAGDRYLFVAVSAGDDTDAGNNRTGSGAVPVTLPPIDYLVTTVSSTGATLAGGPLTGSFQYRNGGANAGSQPVHWIAYVSTDLTWDAADPVIDSGDVAALPGLTTSAAVSFDGTWPAGGGNRYLFVAVSAGDDTNAGNNRTGSGAVPVTLPPVDYLVTAVTSTGLTRAGGSLAGSFQYRNNLTAPGSQIVHWIAYVSSDSTWDAGDPVIDSGEAAALPGLTTSAAVSFEGTWPAGAGNRYLLVTLSAGDDTNAANNTTSSAAVAVGVTDYSGAVTHTGGLTAGAAFAFLLSVDNISGAYALPGSENIYWNVYASRGDTVISADDKVVGSGVTAGLAAGGSFSSGTLNNTWPATAGTYYLIADIFAGDDANTANNRPVSGPLAVAAPPAANVDYTGTVAHVSGTTAGAAFDGTLIISNGGTSAGTQSVSWSVYASLGNATLDSGDTLVASGSQAWLAAGDNSGVLAISDSWPAAAGTYYLVADIQAADDVNSVNNQPASGAVTVNAPPAPAVDYSGSLSSPPLAQRRAGGSFTASITIVNGPAAAGSRTVFWNVYASLGNSTIETGVDKLVASGSSPALPAGGTYGPTAFTSTWPSGTGDYFLVANIQAEDDINLANNRPSSGPFAVGITDYSGAVANTGGLTAGAALTGTLTISNISGTYAQDGAQDIYWNVYASRGDTVISADDKVVGSGVYAGGLAVGDSTGLLPYANTWPATPGTYYLVADIFAGDDPNTANNKPFSSALAVATPPAANVDYSGTVLHLSGTTAGEAFSGTLTISNSGTDAGTQNISWSVYASRANATIGAGDSLVASGTIVGGLPAGGNSGVLLIDNTWPVTAGTYYLVADIQATDDVNSANNQPACAPVTVVPSALLVDYDGTLTTAVSARAGGPLAGSLTVRNLSAATGSSTVHWSVYASLGNTTIETGVDALVGSGSFPGLLPLADSGALAISSTWPLATGDYYLVAQIQADDDANLLNNTPASTVVTVGATDYSGAVMHLSGTTAGASFTFSLLINNAGGTYALPGSQDLYWNVYASRGDAVISVDDKVVGSGIISGGLPAPGSFDSGTLTNTWPGTAGTYYLIADIFAGDDINAANNRPTTSVPVTAPLPPDYALTFTTDPPWSTLVGSAIGGQVRIQNISANAGLQPITYSVYRSADKVLGGDTLLLSGSQPALGAGAYVDVPIADGDLWPTGGQFWYLIATVSAADDAELGNNTIVSHPIAAADGRYKEGAENNGDAGPTPPPFSAYSATGLTLGLNGTIALEGTMDAYSGPTSQYDTYRFVTGTGVAGVSMKVRWQTGYDDIDLYLWDENKGQVSSLLTDVDTEPSGTPTLNIIGLTAGANYYAGLNFWLANNTSGSAGKPYVVLIKGNP